MMWGGWLQEGVVKLHGKYGRLYGGIEQLPRGCGESVSWVSRDCMEGKETA